MAITLGDITFDETHTTVKEAYEEVGGRDERKVEISGLIVGESSAADIEARLDAILAAASDEDYSTGLTIRAGRMLYVRREAFRREISEEALAGSFHLVLAARDPYEVAAQQSTESWSIAISGAAKILTTAGNADARPVIALTAVGTLINPALCDGQRTIAYSGTIEPGSVIDFDSGEGEVRLDGEDVTPYAQGDFPRIAPGGTTLIYTDDAASSHNATGQVKYRDRWW